MATTGRNSDQFALRLPDGLRDRIKSAAEANSRSMNSEIVSTLLKAYPEIDTGVLVDLMELLFIAANDEPNAEQLAFAKSFVTNFNVKYESKSLRVTMPGEQPNDWAGFQRSALKISAAIRNLGIVGPLELDAPERPADVTLTEVMRQLSAAEKD